MKREKNVRIRLSYGAKSADFVSSCEDCWQLANKRFSFQIDLNWFYYRTRLNRPHLSQNALKRQKEPTAAPLLRGMRLKRVKGL